MNLEQDIYQGEMRLVWSHSILKFIILSVYVTVYVCVDVQVLICVCVCVGMHMPEHAYRSLRPTPGVILRNAATSSDPGSLIGLELGN